MKDDIERTNALIERCGYRFNKHYNRGAINILLKTEAGGCSFDIPEKKVSKFIELFDLPNDKEDFYLDEVQGFHVIAWFGENGNGRIFGLSPILDPYTVFEV